MKTLSIFTAPSYIFGGTLLLGYFVTKALFCSNKENECEDDQSSKEDDKTGTSDNGSNDDSNKSSHRDYGDGGYETTMTMPSEWAVFL